MRQIKKTWKDVGIGRLDPLCAVSS